MKKLEDRLLRLKEMQHYLTDEDGWKKEKQYGQRWKSEGRFSVFKGTFGENVYSKNMENIGNEVILKANLMNYFTSSLIKARKPGYTDTS